MTDDNQTQNITPPSDNTQTSEITNSAPTEQTIPITDSISPDVSSVVSEASQNAFTIPPNKDQNEAVIPNLDESQSEVKLATPQTEAKTEHIPESQQTTNAENSETLSSQTPQTSTFEPLASDNHMSELLEKEHLAIENKRRKKLDSIMNLFAKQEKITNDEVEKFLHVSNATATRYLSILKKENKIIQNRKTGKSVFYTLLK